jgi:hypothetical protein
MPERMSCTYRIYPSWFGGESGKAITELAHGSADRMGRRVLAIDVIRNDSDWRGEFIDFRVTYTSTVANDWMQRKP